MIAADINNMLDERYGYNREDDMSHAASLTSIMADHDIRDAARARNSKREHAALVLLGKVCSEDGCYNKPSQFSQSCFGHRHGHIG